MEKHLPAIKAKAEMLNDEQLVIAILKKVLQDGSTVIKYDDVLKRFRVYPSDSDFEITVDTEYNTVEFTLTNYTNRVIEMILYLSPEEIWKLFKEIRKAYMHNCIKSFYKKYCE